MKLLEGVMKDGTKLLRINVFNPGHDVNRLKNLLREVV